MENVVEHVAGRRIVEKHPHVQGETPRRRLLGEMEEGEERRVPFAVDAQVVEPALSRREPVRLEAFGPARKAVEQRPSARAEERGVPQLVLRVAQEEPAEQRIGGQLGGAREIARAVRLGLREAQQLARPAMRIEPHPRVHRAQDAIDRRGPQGIPHPPDASTG